MAELKIPFVFKKEDLETIKDEAVAEVKKAIAEDIIQIISEGEPTEAGREITLGRILKTASEWMKNERERNEED